LPLDDQHEAYAQATQCLRHEPQQSDSHSPPRVYRQEPLYRGDYPMRSVSRKGDSSDQCNKVVQPAAVGAVLRTDQTMSNLRTRLGRRHERF